MCCVNITISLDNRVVERVREVAHAQGTSLQALVRRYLESVAGVSDKGAAGEELLRLMEEHGGRSGGAPFRREDAYEGRL